MDLKHILLRGSIATLSTLAMAEPAAWLPAAGGQLPPGAQAQGREQLPGNEPLYACRAFYAGPGKAAGLHPGKLRPEFFPAIFGSAGATIPARLNPPEQSERRNAWANSSASRRVLGRLRLPRLISHPSSRVNASSSLRVFNLS